MKLIAHLILFALVPFLSGCLSMVTTKAANTQAEIRTLYGLADKIEKAGITKDNQLCVFFEKALTNSAQSRTAVVIPIADLRWNAAQVQRRLATQGLLRTTNNSTIPTYATWRVRGSAVRTNWTLLENLEADLKPVPVGPSRLSSYGDAAGFTLLSNATETVYLTRTAPSAFVYVDASIKSVSTIVEIEPYVVSTQGPKHPGYYLLLPLTVPIDIATAPIQIPVLLAFKYGDWHM